MPVIDREPTANIGAVINLLPTYRGSIFPEITSALPVTEILDPTKNLEVIKGSSRFELRSELTFPTTSIIANNEKGRDRYKRRGRGRRNRGCCNRDRNNANFYSPCPHSSIPGLKSAFSTSLRLINLSLNPVRIILV